ncbi:MAG: hypothetical protein KGZ58_03625 [Ignavibacteriales bacterium]|nr:hypothetical protein [Ignavibacteriales bacterium]
MDLLYLDYNCFQRGFDDQQQIKIELEALACEEIFVCAERKEIQLVWSFMHEDENFLCPFIERKIEVNRLSFLCEIRVAPMKEIYALATTFQQQANVSPKDALHLACANFVRSNFFLSCDTDLLKRTKRLAIAMKTMNPIDYIKEQQQW